MNHKGSRGAGEERSDLAEFVGIQKRSLVIVEVLQVVTPSLGPLRLCGGIEVSFGVSDAQELGSQRELDVQLC